MDDFGWGSRWEAEWEAYRVTGQRRAEAAGPAWLRSKKHPSSAQKAHLVRDDNEKRKAKATAKDARLRRPLQVADGAERGLAHDGRCALVTLRGPRAAQHWARRYRRLLRGGDSAGQE